MMQQRTSTQASEKEAGGDALLDPKAWPAKRWAASAVALRRVEEAGVDGSQEKNAASGRVVREFGKRVAAGFVAQGAWKGLLWLWEHWG